MAALFEGSKVIIGSLRYLLELKVHSFVQKKGILRLLGLNYLVHYIGEVTNVLSEESTLH